MKVEIEDGVKVMLDFLSKGNRNRILDLADAGNYYTVKKLHNHMKRIFTKEYQDVMEIYNCIPAEQWENYKAFGIKNLTEQRKLKEAKAKLNEAVDVVFNLLDAKDKSNVEAVEEITE